MSKRKGDNRFASLLHVAREGETAETEESQTLPQDTSPQGETMKIKEPEIAPQDIPPSASPIVDIGKRKRGRPPGQPKRDNADFEPLTVYIRIDTKTDVQMALLKQRRNIGIREDMSDLIERLLQQWLTSQS